MPATASAHRRSRIAFERPTVTRSGLGGRDATGWSHLGHARARVLYGSGDERARAGVETAVQAATFRVLANSLTRAVTATDRIVFAGLFWDIVAIAALATVPAEIEFTATAKRG